MVTSHHTRIIVGEFSKDHILTSHHMMEALKGQWVRDSADNYDKLLKELAVNWLLRKAAEASTPVMEITEESGEWTIKSSTTLKTVELKFKIGEKFEETTPDGREVESVSTVENGKLVIKQTAKKAGQKSTTSVRELDGDCLKYTITVEGSDVVCVQTFSRSE